MQLLGICVLRSPSLLSNRGELLELCREELHKNGYEYKKGQSCSKVLNPRDAADQRSKREKIEKNYEK